MGCLCLGFERFPVLGLYLHQPRRQVQQRLSQITTAVRIDCSRIRLTNCHSFDNLVMDVDNYEIASF